MTMPDPKFFLGLDLESSDAEGGAAVQQVFQHETYVLSKDNSHYIENLREQMEVLDRLKKQR